jgi:hypothetical protein
MLNPKSSWPRSMHQRHFTCEMCGGALVNTCELQFDSGSIEPTVGETLTGATSADTITGYIVVTTVDGTESNSYPFTLSIPSGYYSASSALAGSGVVVSVDLESGSWSDGDAVGTVTLSSPSGVTEDGGCFVDDASVNGSIGGNNMFVATHDGIVKTEGLVYPESEGGYFEGKWYCAQHLDFMLGRDKYAYKLGNLGD